jgi:hypothetical protein
MGYNPTTHRFVCVLNKKIDLCRAMNTLGHMAAGLTALFEDTKALRFQDYIDADGGVHKSISDNPFIILRADNSNKIRALRNNLIEKEIPFTDFTHTMIEGTYVDQHNQTNETKEEDLEYHGICFFAKDEQAKELTKKFSLYK